ncbi:hypothetical protein L0244_35200 [bacterium]|nr:hypothetical protein [bacterium]
MEIRFSCPNCHSKYSAQPEAAGQKGKCYKCGAMIVVPLATKDDLSSKSGSEAGAKNRPSKRLRNTAWSIVAFIVLFIVNSITGHLSRSTVRKYIDSRSPENVSHEAGREINSVLEEISRELNTRCPMQVDKYTTVLNTFAVDRKVIYNCRIDLGSMIRDTKLSFAEVREAQRQFIINNFCTNPTFDTFKQFDVKLENQYCDMSGKFLFKVEASKDVCAGR